VNIASLPSTDTLVIGLGRNRGPEGGALCCGRAFALAATGQSATLKHKNSKKCETDLVMKPVVILIRATPALARGFPALVFSP
jgi:hypothetical protein